jgi:ubiquinone/menaquinone biosynthesis C-methylase UbiE
MPIISRQVMFELIRSRLSCAAPPGKVYWENRVRSDVANGLNGVSWIARQNLVDEILQVVDTERIVKVLEVGSGYGANLITLSRNALGSNFTGIDVSQASLDLGREYIEKIGITDIHLRLGEACLLPFDDNSFDLVIVDAVFLYIEPQDFQKALSEILRVSRNYIVLVELHAYNVGKGKKIRDGYLYDFDSALRKVSGIQFKLKKIPPNVRSAGRWLSFGHLCFINLI